MKISEIQDIPLSKIMSLSQKDLQKITERLAMYSNKRLERLSERKMTTPATEFIKKHGGKFKATGDIYQLRAELQRAQGFLKAETSTVTGFKRWESKVSRTLKTNTGINYNSLKPAQKRRFWKAFSKLGELDIANIKGANYRTAVNEIYDAIKGGLKQKDLDSYVTRLSTQIYENATQNPFTGENNPFDYK